MDEQKNKLEELPLKDFRVAIPSLKEPEAILAELRAAGAEPVWIEGTRSAEEAPSQSQSEKIANLANQILVAEVDAILFMTGAQTQAFISRAVQLVPRDRFLDSLADTQDYAGCDAFLLLLVVPDTLAQPIARPTY